MAIDKKKISSLLSAIDGLFDQVARGIPAQAVQFIKEKVLGAAVADLRDMVVNARPPRLYLMGRSGHGKSSLINALANREVAVVGDVKPTTTKSEFHQITFADVHAAWEVIDSRGIFEATKPDGAPDGTAVQQVQADLLKHKPDIILHAVAARETRSMSEDIRVGKEIRTLLQRKLGVIPPTVIVLTQTDLVNPARDWPPAPNSTKLKNIRTTVDYVTKDILGLKTCEALDPDEPAHGCTVTEDSFVKAVVPVAAPRGEPFWNVELLSACIGALIPKEAQLDFFQAQQRKALLRQAANSVVDRFSAIAGVVGASPIPISDMAILTPLQLLMVAVIGGLSCRSLSVETTGEFLAASGATMAAGFVLRVAAQQTVKMIPGLGSVVSGAVAATGTKTLGQSAVAYFFRGEVRRPAEFLPK
jgi:uncharacterized protein (DUF697 family)/GTP-binding protein EngB required for normal cell division